MCVEPAHIPLKGILPARVITRVGLWTLKPSQLSTQTGRFKAQASDSRAYVMLANFSDTPLVILKFTVLGVAELVSEALVDGGNASRPCVETHKGRKNEVVYRNFLEGKLGHLPSKERGRIEPVLLKYAHVFHDEDSNDFKTRELVEHEIILEDSTPIR